MSTRCNVVLKDYYQQNGFVHEEKLHFYRHLDGYPSGVEETLTAFLNAVAKGVLRNNVGQSGGWLIILGALEYEVDQNAPFNADPDQMMGWKVGAYEPTLGLHGDIEYLYEIDLMEPCITAFRVKTDWKHLANGGDLKQEFEQIFTVGPGKDFPKGDW
jgi:hypothetical protein